MLFDFLTNYVHTYTTGSPAGYTGSPGDGNNCKACHTSSVSVQNTGAITSNIPGTGYTPGNTYTITASVTGNSTKFGFQASPQNASGTLIGTLISTNAQTQLTGGSKYITHSLSGTTGSGSKSWSFDWRAPAVGTGNVTFYAAFNVSNSDNSFTGDTIKLKSITITEDLTNNKDITSFKFSDLNPEAIGTIDPNAQTIDITVPSGTNVVSLIPTIMHTGASVNPPSDSANDFSSPQIYTVTALNGSTKSYTVSVNIQTLVENLSLKNSLEIYPNPASDKVYIKQSDLNKITLITVINRTGKIVKTFAMSNAMENFSIADFLPGIYYIKADTEKGTIIKKVIKL